MNQSGCNCENATENRTKQKYIKIIKIVAFLVSAAAVLGLVGYFVIYPKIAYWSGDYKTYIDMKQIQHFAVPDSVRHIPDYAFEDCDSLESVTIPDSVKSIGEGAFASCNSLESVTFGNGVENIGASAFRGCDVLKNVTLPNGVKSIGESAFAYCYSLESVTFGNGVESVGKSAFYGCDSLTSIMYGGGVEGVGDFAARVLSNCANKAKCWGKGHFDAQRFVFAPDANSKRYIFEPLAVDGAEHIVLKVATPTFVYDGFGVFDAANNELITQGCTVLQSDADYTYVCYDVSTYDAIYCSADAWSFDVLEIYLI